MARRAVNAMVGIERRQRLNRSECKRRAEVLGEGMRDGLFRGKQRERARLNRNYYAWLAKHGGTRGKILAMFLAAILLQTGCGGLPDLPEAQAPAAEVSAEQPGTIAVDTGGTAASVAPVASTAYIEQGGTKIAYVLLFGSNSAQLYVPSVSRYVQVDLDTGVYLNGLVYYTGANCTGTAYAGSFAGVYGKTITVGNAVAYYLVNSKVVGAISANSFFSGSCTNYGAATAIATSYNVQAVARPYDFAGIAPLAVQFQ